MIQAVGAALSAINAFARKFGVSANNIANLNTDGFKKSRVIMTEENPAGIMATINRVESPGAPIPSSDGSPEMRESSNVLVEEELIALTVAKHGYNANLKVMKAQDDLLGSLFDIKG